MEGIELDDHGNLLIVEDVGGKAGPTTPSSKQPNSFVYRFVPKDASDLTQGGVLQALQVIDGDHPITFHAGQNDADILGQDMADLHTYGKSFRTAWVTLHDTEVDGTTAFSAGDLAKAKGATPFKRPENGVFRPDGRFDELVFTETGDTSAVTEAGASHGGFGALFKLDLDPRGNGGSLSMLYRGDVAHTGLDNITFVSRDQLIAVEDAGDGLHQQRNALDSAYLFDVTADYSAGLTPTRVLAQGRDASATIDAACGSACRNDGDNEITGIHVSDGDPTVAGLFGSRSPLLFKGAWRFFFTRQHGDNVTFEVLPSRGAQADHGPDTDNADQQR
jgi:secreted PhoX family phosphatase